MLDEAKLHQDSHRSYVFRNIKTELELMSAVLSLQSKVDQP
jgi:hypothetical protein